MSDPVFVERGGVRGYLHRPAGVAERGLVLAHGAGSNANAPLLVRVALEFVARGYCVLRCDLAFRQRRASGPPSPATAALDRAGLRDAVDFLRGEAGVISVGGHSYGGRQASMLMAEEDAPAVAGLLLLSYPLHPPKKPEQLRTAHFPKVKTSAIFVHGSRDPFGSLEELRAAIRLIPVAARLIEVAGAGHDLKQGRFDLGGLVV